MSIGASPLDAVLEEEANVHDDDGSSQHSKKVNDFSGMQTIVPKNETIAVNVDSSNMNRVESKVSITDDINEFLQSEDNKDRFRTPAENRNKVDNLDVDGRLTALEAARGSVMTH